MSGKQATGEKMVRRFMVKIKMECQTGIKQFGLNTAPNTKALSLLSDPLLKALKAVLNPLCSEFLTRKQGDIN